MWTHWSEEKIKKCLKNGSIGLMHISLPISLMLALLMFAIFLTSLFLGRYDIDPCTVVLMLLARLVDLLI